MTMKTEKCLHNFRATPKKGKWKVRVFGTNNRGRISIEEVSTTVFRCSKCGDIKEFPDNWEWNYITPGKSTRKNVFEKRSPKIRARG